jgi:hypothetical protein
VWVKIGPNYNISNPNVPTDLEGYSDAREDYPLRRSPVQNLPGSCLHSKVGRQDTRRHRHHAPTAIIKRVASVVT